MAGLVVLVVLFIGLPLGGIGLFGAEAGLFVGIICGAFLGLISTVLLYLPWRSTWQRAYGWSGEEAAEATWDEKERVEQRWRLPMYLGILVLIGVLFGMCQGLRALASESMTYGVIAGSISGLCFGLLVLILWLRSRVPRGGGS